MRRVRIQKRRPARAVPTQLQGGWKPIEALTTRVVTSPLSKAERDELHQRQRLYTLIQEHAVA